MVGVMQMKKNKFQTFNGFAEQKILTWNNGIYKTTTLKTTSQNFTTMVYVILQKMKML